LQASCNLLHFDSFPTRRSSDLIYLRTQNYPNNLRRLGYTEEDLDGQGSDKLVEAIVAWGDIDTVIKRIQAHHDAGADHVCIQVLDRKSTRLNSSHLVISHAVFC